MNKILLLVSVVLLVGCSPTSKTQAFVGMAKLCDVGSKQTITYRITGWGGFLETKCEFVVTEDEK